MTEAIELEFPHWLETTSRSHPGRLALAFGGNQCSFADLRRNTHAAVAVLTRAGGNRGGRLGILSTNRPGFVFAIHAATSMNVPFVPLNWRQTADEIAWQLQDAGITVLVVDEERASVAAAAAGSVPVEIVPIARLERAGDQSGSRYLCPRIDLTRDAAIVYTSGTSGRPKGARITFGNLWFSAIASALHLGGREDDVWLAALPLFHIGGLSMLFRSVIGATPLVLHDRFDPELTLHAIDEGASLVSVVPTMLQRILEMRHDHAWPASLRCVLVGGSAAPSGLIEECLGRGIPVAPTYGLTEGSSQVTTLLPDDARFRPSSSGLPLPLTEIRVTRSSEDVFKDEIGEIEFRGPTLFAGYLGDEPGTADREPDGWFRTGDIGRLDNDGYLYVVDRRDDLIVSGGENIYPSEIERVLLDHPQVIDAGVIAVVDLRWGTRPIAAVIWRGDGANIGAELRRHCESRLAGYKIPDRFISVSELSRSPSGKLLRNILREKIP